jgi:acetylornithine deacetylase/succinyl-diaminopimelate desuccinylase-like protein
MMPGPRLDEIFAKQDVAALTEMTRDLVNIRSETGNEGEIGDYVSRRFGELGMMIEQQPVEKGRNNVVARRFGKAPGPTLMLLAHFDTSTTPGEDLPIGYQPTATLQDGWIYGLGVSNMKCAFSGFWSALQMMRDAGVDPPGEVMVAGVIGEILKAPVDDWRGRKYRGGGLGAHYLLSHGAVADFCINGEPTGLRLQPLNGGYVFLRIHVKGSPQEAFSKHKAIDPLPKAFRIHAALQDWEREYQAANSHPHIRPQIVVGSVYGGYPFKPHITAPFCNLYLHVQTLPGTRIVDVRRSVEELISGLRRDDPELEFDVSAYLNEDGYEIPFDHPGAQAVGWAHELVFGEPVRVPNPERNAISSDNNSLAAHNIPAVTYGAGGISLSGDYAMYEPGIGEVVKIENLVKYAQVCAAATLKIQGYEFTD